MSDTSDTTEGTPPTPAPTPMSATLEGRAERATIPEQGGVTHIDYKLKVSQPPAPTDDAKTERKPLALSLVLDRSGSMGGGKLDVAKYATSAVLDRLDERDLVSVTVFDTQIDLIQPLAAATPERKEAIRAELARVQPRGGTALFDGWQRGVQALTDQKGATKDRLAHCFLLTDGQANNGLTDIEQIATEVGMVQQTQGIGTSTFGIGDDYQEELLGPMSVAGGGQFHHIDEPGEIARMFVTQLGELLAVALPHVRLEFDFPAGAKAEVISAYWAHPGAEEDGRVTTIGDLLAGETRSIVFALTFPAGKVGEEVHVRARLVWAIEGGEQASGWNDVTLTYATLQDYEATPMNPMAFKATLRETTSRARMRSVMSLKGVRDRSSELAEVDMLLRQYEQALQLDPTDPDLLHGQAQLLEIRDKLTNGTFHSGDLKRMYMLDLGSSRGTLARMQYETEQNAQTPNTPDDPTRPSQPNQP